MPKLRFRTKKQELRSLLRKKLIPVLDDMEKWVRNSLAPAIVYGGLGIEGIKDTEFYSWISSPDGLSQLGIDESEPPKLLQAYINSVEVSRTQRSIILSIGDTEAIRSATPHPARGTGNLQVNSWMDWVLFPIVVGAGYVSRDELPNRLEKYIRLDNPLGGLMLSAGSFGSSGSWRVPQEYRNFSSQWLKRNNDKISKAFKKELNVLVDRYLS